LYASRLLSPQSSRIHRHADGFCALPSTALIRHGRCLQVSLSPCPITMTHNTVITQKQIFTTRRQSLHTLPALALTALASLASPSLVAAAVSVEDAYTLDGRCVHVCLCVCVYVHVRVCVRISQAYVTPQV